MTATTVPTMHPDIHPGDALYLDTHSTDGVHIGVNGDRRMFKAAVIVKRADLLAAVSALCDVIVVDRAELPEVAVVTPGEVGIKGHGIYTLLPGDTAEFYRKNARRHLALAEYLDAHPPVDEARVEAAYDVISVALRDAGLKMADVDHGVRMDIARRLVEQGWSK
jgi:hypothetical protein